MKANSIGFNALILISSALYISACGTPPPNLTDQDIAAATTPCPNPIQYENSAATELSTDHIVDGKDGMYRATKMDYYFEASSWDDKHATHSLQTRVTRSAPDASPQYAMAMSCKHGYYNTTLDASVLLPDTIDRKDGTITAKTEKFKIDKSSLISHSTEDSGTSTLSDYLYPSGFELFTTQSFKIYKTSETGFDIIVKKTNDATFATKTTLLCQIHYELDAPSARK